MASLNQIMDHLADVAIVDQGINGIWYYRKWSDGRAELWTRFSPTVKAGTSYNGLYYASYSVDGAFPFTFTERPDVIGACCSGTLGFLGDITYTESGITAYEMYRAGAGNVGSALSVYVSGKWK